MRNSLLPSSRKAAEPFLGMNDWAADPSLPTSLGLRLPHLEGPFTQGLAPTLRPLPPHAQPLPGPPVTSRLLRVPLLFSVPKSSLHTGSLTLHLSTLLSSSRQLPVHP